MFSMSDSFLVVRGFDLMERVPFPHRGSFFTHGMGQTVNIANAGNFSYAEIQEFKASGLLEGCMIFLIRNIQLGFSGCQEVTRHF